MILNRFDYESLRPAPWKNGGGLTREIVSLGDPFDWRVSIAEVASDGPFSVFEGIDRTIVLLEGSGLHLQSFDGTLEHRLEQPLQPFDFSGDLQLDSSQLGGASCDFNVMTRRSRGRSTVRVHHAGGELPSAARGLIYIASGQWSVEVASATQVPAGDQEKKTALLLQARQGLWWSCGLPTLHVNLLSQTPIAAAPALIAVTWSQT